MAFIQFENVSFKYNENTPFVVKNLSFTIEKGEHVAFIGRNGSGKSTTARLMNGLALPDKGKVIVDGIQTTQKNKLYDIRKTVGVVFQNPDNQTVASIVEDDVAFGPENLGIPRKEIRERVDFALQSVGMQDYAKATPSRLSGGQKQRIAIAGVLAIRPQVIVLDESTAMLDPRGRKEITGIVEKLNKEQGLTVVTITHYMEEAVNADRIIVMNRGEIAMQGTPQEIFSRGEELQSFGLDLPLACKVANALIQKGLPLPKIILNREQPHP